MGLTGLKKNLILTRSALGTGLEVGLVMSSTVNADPQENSTHSTNVAKLPQGGSLDNCTHVAVLRPGEQERAQAVIREGGLMGKIQIIC